MPLKFEVKLRKAGSSLVISVPTPAYKGVGWKEGDKLELTVTDSELVVRKVTRKGK